MSDNKGICGELVFTARIAVGRSCKTSGTERDRTCKQKMPSPLFSDKANICCCKADRRMASYPTRTVPFKVDIHYITSYITYKRYNLNKNRKHINTYIYVYLQKHSNKFSKPFNNRHLEFPTNSLALIQYSLFALLDNLSRNDLILRSKTCCQWISLPHKQLLTTMDKTANTNPS